MSWLKRLFGGEAPASPGPQWAPYFTAADHERFVATVEGELRRRALSYQMGDGVVAVQLSDGEPDQWGLQNLSQVCHQNKKRDWRRVVAGHIDAMLAAREQQAMVKELAKDFTRARGLLRLRLYPDDFAPELAAETIFFEPAEGVRAVLCFDLPTSVASVSRTDAKVWGKSDEDLFAIALQNVRAHERVEIDSQEVKDGVSVQMLFGDSHFTSCHALFLREYLGEGAVHGAVVAIPHRHVLLFHPIRDVGVVLAINALITMAFGMHAEGPGSITPDLFWWREGKFTRLPSSVKPDGITFTPPDEFVDLLNALSAPPAK